MDYFVHECPVCGRPLRISAAYSGQYVTCCHCGGRFIAEAASTNGHSLAAQEGSLLHRADQLLGMVSRHLSTAGGPSAGTARPACP